MLRRGWKKNNTPPILRRNDASSAPRPQVTADFRSHLRINPRDYVKAEPRQQRVHGHAPTVPGSVTQLITLMNVNNK